MRKTLPPTTTLSNIPIAGSRISDYAHMLVEYPTCLEALRAAEMAQNLAVVWAWPNKTVAEVQAILNAAAEPSSKREFLPDEIWVMGNFHVARRFAPRRSW